MAARTRACMLAAVAVCLSLCVHMNGAALAAPTDSLLFEYYDGNGPYNCERSQFVRVPHNSEYKRQSGDSGASMWVPSGPGPFPVVGWSHGITLSPSSYDKSLRQFCTWGMIIIATTASGTGSLGGADYGTMIVCSDRTAHISSPQHSTHMLITTGRAHY